LKLFHALLLLPLLGGCASSGPAVSLTQARTGFKTQVTAPKIAGEAAETAPPAIFATVKYPAPAGSLTAYVSPNPKDGKKHPAIVWITGGDCNSIGDVWSPATPDNDQTAAAFRKAGIVMMFPSLRGGNNNPGVKEGFLGEVDDVLAATKWLEKQPYVDSKRIYLGGHSTGGTLAMLVAESSPRFRATFAFGPVDDVAGYGADSGFLPFNISNEQEVKLRSPGYWLDSIKSPVWVIEGTSEGNIDAVQTMKNASSNPNAHFLTVQGADHFSVLAPTNRLLAQKILSDSGETTNISLTDDELTQNFSR
jgi:dipeptidyl aminopeptidase/acylaminoacyl peptidase